MVDTEYKMPDANYDLTVRVDGDLLAGNVTRGLVIEALFQWTYLFTK